MIDKQSGVDTRVGVSRNAALIAVHLSVVLITLDISLTSTALPTIAKSLGVEAAQSIWIVNAYYLAVVAALLPLAALGDIYGHRLIFLGGLSTFAVGALASGLSVSIVQLALARAVLGFGAAAIAATTPALIRTLYPPERLGRGLGVYALVVGVSFSAGPTLTSLMLAVTAWPWLYFAVLPLAAVALSLAGRALPSIRQSGRNFDAVAAGLTATFFASGLFGIVSVAQRGGALTTVAAWTVAAVAAFSLMHRERGSPTPILAFDLFRIPVFTLSALTSVCAFTIQGLVFVVLPFLFQTRLGYSQVEAGFLITPWPTTLAAMTLIAGPLADRMQAGLLGGIGLSIVAVGLAALASIPLQASAFDIGWRLVMCGIGFGLFQSPNMKAIMSSAPANRSGPAGGILAASRLIGQSLGAAAVAICLGWSTQSGSSAAIWVGAAAAVLGSIISSLRLLPSMQRYEPTL